MSRNRLVLFLIAIFALAVFVGCGSGNDDSNSGADTSTETVAASDCTPDNLNTFKGGILTIGTDSPAYPPYFEDNDPSNGKGFESALGYAIADQLGFNHSQVEWTTVPFNASYAPGAKDFDFDLNQISITPPREKVVTFSIPYYTANQAVLVKKGSDLADITSVDDLKDATIGVQVGTTSYDAVNDVIQPDSTPKTFDNSNDVVTAFKQDQVDAIVVDLPTAIYLRDVELSDTVVAGQFEQAGGDQWGALMAKDSDLKGCVDKAIESLKSDGTLDELEQQWMADSAKAPMLN